MTVLIFMIRSLRTVLIINIRVAMYKDLVIRVMIVQLLLLKASGLGRRPRRRQCGGRGMFGWGDGQEIGR